MGKWKPSNRSEAQESHSYEQIELDDIKKPFVDAPVPDTRPIESVSLRGKLAKWSKSISIVITFAFLFGCILILSLIFVTRSPSSRKPRRSPSDDLKSIYSGPMNPAQDPCENFYKFACGNFEKTVTIPNGTDIFDAETRAINESYQLLGTRLAAMSSAHGSSKAFDLAGNLYSKCMDLDLLRRENLFQLQVLTDSFGNKTQEEQLTLALLAGVPTVISLSFEVNREKKRRILIFDALPEGWLNSEEPKNTETSLEEEFISSALKMYHPSKSDHEAEEEAKLLIQLGASLIEAKSNVRVDQYLWEGPISTIDLASPNLKLKTILQSISEVDESSQVKVQSKPFFSTVYSIFQGKLDLLAKYHSWQALMKYGPLLSEKFDDQLAKFMKAKRGRRPIPRNDFCVKLVVEKLPHVMSRVLIDAKPLIKENVLDVGKLFIHQLQGMEAIIAETDWIDEISKTRSIEKARYISIKLGYPQWVENDELLTESVPPDMSFGEFLHAAWGNLTSFLLRKQLKILNEPIDPQSQWDISAASRKMSYVTPQNTIHLPAVFIGGPYWRRSRPDFWNVGALGSIVSHEIAHAFDNQGILFNASGHPEGLLSKIALEKFEPLEQEMKKLYSGINDSVTGVKLRGGGTLKENIADFTGLRLAYRTAFGQEPESKYQPLPAFDGFSAAQLFFISYANLRCAFYTPEGRRSVIKSYPHVPKDYRVNVPLANFEEFAVAFKCPPNSTMNPYVKVRIW